MMQKIDIMPMSYDDIFSVLEIEKECFSCPWSYNSLKDSFENDLSYFVCAKLAKEVVGYAGMYHADKEGYVFNIAVRKSFRNMKIGTHLTNALINHCKDLSLDFLSLEVRESNVLAINLYKKLMFKEIAVRKNFYDNPKENAIIMTRYL